MICRVEYFFNALGFDFQIGKLCDGIAHAALLFECSPVGKFARNKQRSRLRKRVCLPFLTGLSRPSAIALYKDERPMLKICMASPTEYATLLKPNVRGS